MDRVRVQSRRAVTLVGGSQVSPELLEEALKFAPVVMAADGGADHALAAGYEPEAVFGDLDSLSTEGRARLDPAKIHQIDDQDTTDFEKCLTSIHAPLVIAVGFAEQRLDHTLAALSVLVRDLGPSTILLGDVDVVAHIPRQIELDLPERTRLSLFPLMPVTGRSKGLRWPIDGLDLRPDGRVATSNEISGPLRLDFDGPGTLLLVPRAFLGQVVAAVGA